VSGASVVYLVDVELLLETRVETARLVDRCRRDIKNKRFAVGHRNLADIVHGIAVDVGDAGAVAAAMEATLDPCPVVDILVANAGIAGIIKNAWDYTLDEWNRLLRIDLTSVFLSCRAVIPQMLERKYGRIVIVSSIAGMEGALPSVVGGLVGVPVIAVPTSVGYGASFGGLAALLGMLNSCASGLSVVNIDNGFGAGYQAALINRLPERE